MNAKVTLNVVAALVAIASLTGCGASSTPAEPSVSAGKAEVHERIKALTDCTELQKQFDDAEQNGKNMRAQGKSDLSSASTAYMKTALERQQELKCFG